MNYFKNRTILITGGTGSFGNAFVDLLIKKKILFKELRIFSRDEKKQDDLRKKINNPKIKFIIGDVRDRDSLKVAVKGSDFIFHAAALKQVPSCEFYPLEAIKTNILGANNLIDLAIIHPVKKIVFLSTDKAVYPINAMGMSKALMEKVALSSFNINKKNGPIISVKRYGNVLATRGSVVPLFIKQILSNQPISLTDPTMTRFIMPMEKAINLVLYALKNSKGGEIFVQKTPATTVYNLLHAVLGIFNKKNYKINIIGVRHGEKNYESLLTNEEMIRAKDIGDYFCINSDQRDLNYDLYFKKGLKKITAYKDYNSNNTQQLTVEQTKKILLKLDIFKNKDYSAI